MNHRDELINEICKQKGIAVEYLSETYLLRFTKGNTTRHIFGPYWDINSAAADRLACDKAGCYTVLNRCGVPAIEHVLMYNPLRRAYLMDDGGHMQKIIAYFNANGGKVVAKPNHGAQGRDVYFCDTLLALEHAIQTIFATEPDVALCPFHAISTEYRVYYLNGRAVFSYGKTTGDDWKHNLSQGAKAFELKDASLREELAALAVNAAKCIDICFATIDIALIDNNRLAVMEINSGVQAQYLLQQLPHLRGKIKSIYAEAIETMFSTN